jgi:hypothetical protein
MEHFLTTVSDYVLCSAVVTFFTQPKRSEYKSLHSRGEVSNAGLDKKFSCIALTMVYYNLKLFFGGGGGVNHHRGVFKEQVF